VVWGLRDTTKALRAVAPDLKRDMTRRMKAPIAATAAQARGLLPSRTGAARAGIKVKSGGSSKTRFGFRLTQLDAGGSVIELAAAGSTAQGQSLVATLDQRYGPPGRFLYRAWDDNERKVYAVVAGTVNDIQAELQQRINAANDKG
jgi:hypothetical protein